MAGLTIGDCRAQFPTSLVLALKSARKFANNTQAMQMVFARLEFEALNALAAVTGMRIDRDLTLSTGILAELHQRKSASRRGTPSKLLRPSLGYPRDSHYQSRPTLNENRTKSSKPRISGRT